jgi:hypothetical protein
MTDSKSDYLYVSSVVPFSASITCWLQIKNLPLDELLKRSRRYERSFIAWEIVRKNRNPFFVTGTGFEGYYIGICATTDEVLKRIIQVSQKTLDCMSRQYHLNFRFQSRLMKTLTGDVSDVKAMYVWAAQLGATIAQLRCNLHDNRDADLFRIETYRTVQTLPPIDYQTSDHCIQQTYALGRLGQQSKVEVHMNGLKPSEQDAWLVAWSIGQFGHPVVRAYLEESYQLVPDTPL